MPGSDIAVSIGFDGSFPFWVDRGVNARRDFLHINFRIILIFPYGK